MFQDQQEKIIEENRIKGHQVYVQKTDEKALCQLLLNQLTSVPACDRNIDGDSDNPNPPYRSIFTGLESVSHNFIKSNQYQLPSPLTNRSSPVAIPPIEPQQLPIPKEAEN